MSDGSYYVVQLAHVEQLKHYSAQNQPAIAVGDPVQQGEPIGVVSAQSGGGCYNQSHHIHMQLYSGSDANRTPQTFTDKWTISGCKFDEGTTHEGELVPCASPVAPPAEPTPTPPPAPPGTAFWLPIQAPNEVYVTQGNNQGDHVASLGQKYAFDLVVCHNQFSTCAGSFVITAAQSGTVLGVNDASTTQCGLPCPCWKQANFIVIQNDDDPRHTASLYLHIMPGSAMVRRGQHVAAGTPLAMAGTTGCSTGIHLHFQVEAVPTYSANPSTGWWYTNSQPMNFADPDVLSVEPNGIPQTGDRITLGMGAPTPTATATPVPTATPIPTVTPVPASGQPGSCTSTTFGIIATCAMVAVISRRRLPKQRPAKHRSERQGE